MSIESCAPLPPSHVCSDIWRGQAVSILQPSSSSAPASASSSSSSSFSNSSASSSSSSTLRFRDALHSLPHFLSSFGFASNSDSNPSSPSFASFSSSSSDSTSPPSAEPKF